MAPPSITKDVHVPKNLHGKIIGKQAATLKDIESDYPGVKVTVPRRNDPSEFVRLAGPEDAVRRAERRVLDIAGVLSDEAAAERKKVDELRRDKDRLFEEANKAMGPKRHQLLDAAHAKKRELEEEQKAAAQRIFKRKNTGYGLEQMDLHGLHLDEAMERVRERLKKLEAGDVASVEIITGAGHHSEGNKARIKPAVEALLKERSSTLSYEEMGGGGGFKVRLSYGDTAVPVGGVPVGGVPVQIEVEAASGGSGFLSALLSCFGCFSKREESSQSTRAPGECTMERT